MSRPISADTLAARFAALQDERARSWPPEKLAQNAAQRAAAVAGFDPARAVRVGDRIGPAELIDTRGGAITLDALMADGPAVLIFFRFADCPADNVALPYYDRLLAPALAEASVPLVAVSPQPPAKLDAIRARHGLRFAVASDPDNRLARSLGLTFTPADRPSPPPPGWIGELAGTDSWELPRTSGLIVDRDRIVRFVSVDPDWLDRTEADAILAALSIPSGARDASALAA